MKEKCPEVIKPHGFAHIGLDMPYRIIVQNNPVNFVDPDGQNTIAIAENILTGIEPYIARIGAFVTGLIAGNEISKECNNNKKCKPCIPPVGTIAADVHQVPPQRPHGSLPGDHVHWFKMNQSPYPECRCFWQRNFIDPTSGSALPPGTPQVTPATGGGPM